MRRSIYIRISDSRGMELSEEYTYKETRECITGGKQELYKKLSVERRVEQSTVPAFIWHTMEDKCVPVENSLMLVNEYRKYGVPFSFLIFEKGGHGMSLANKEVYRFGPEEEHLKRIGKWVDLACDWLLSRGFV